MQNIQLYIEGQRVDLFKDESINITQSIQNVKDIAKIFTDFTKTFSVPASKINNKIFKHYYNFDITGGFDARTKKNATIELNSLPFRDGKIKLEGVDLKNNVAHTYRITFFGSTVELKDLLGEDKLQSLNLISFNRVYNPVIVRNALGADPLTNDIIVPLITHTQRLIYDSSSGNHEDGNLSWHSGDGQANYHGVLFSDLKFAIRVDVIIRAIESKYNLTFSDDFFTSSNEHYYNLFLWLHRKKGDVQNLSGLPQSILSGFTSTSYDDDTNSQILGGTTLSVDGIMDKYNAFNLTLTPASYDVAKAYAISIQIDGQEVYNTGTVNDVITIPKQISYTQGGYKIYIQSEQPIFFESVKWSLAYSGNGFPATIEYINTNYGYSPIFNFDVSQQIPEMKIIDFLTGLFKMFNLTAYVDSNTKKIVVKTLDEFYNDGGSYDITQYVDVSKSSVNIALPYKEINFQYEGVKTFLASKFSQLSGEQWAKKSWIGGGEKLDGGIYTVKLPFEHLQFERLTDGNGGGKTDIQYGYFVDDNQDPYFDKPLLFYPIRQTNATGISFLNSVSTKQQVTTYNIPSNSVSINPATSKKNINFSDEKNEYTGTNGFDDTLFNVFYRKYIVDIFNETNRITKVTAYLPLKILLNYTLADRFVINGHSYKINSINTNLETGKSELELLNDL